MEKKKLFGNTLKEQYLASARDRRHNFLLSGGAMRGVILNGTRMVNEMRSNHELGILETLVLGRAYLGAALMAADLKGNDRIAVRIECSGPIQGLNVEANAFAEVRGYLKLVASSAQPEKDLDDLVTAPSQVSAAFQEESAAGMSEAETLAAIEATPGPLDVAMVDL